MSRDDEIAPPLPDPLRRNPVWMTFQILMRVAFTIGLRYRARGLEHVPAEGGGLLLANHQSFLDPLLVGLPINRPVSYLARDSLFRVPVVGWILRRTYVVPINRRAASAATIRAAVARLRHGFLVGVFPEGTRSADGTVGSFKPGFVALLRRGDVPVIPVGVAGAFEAFPRTAKLPRPSQVCVVFGKPIPPQDLPSGDGRDRDSQLVELVRERVIECQSEAEAWRRTL